MPGGDDFDDLLSALGFGRWQIPSLVVTILAMSQFSVHLIGSPLLAAPLPFRCSTPPLSSRSNSSLRWSPSPHYDDLCLAHPTATPLGIANTTSTSVFTDGNISAVITSTASDPGTTTASQAASTHSAWHSTSLQSCPVVQYDTSVFTSTIISEWHLVCERAVLRPLFQTLFTLGGMVGSTAGGHIADRWGRRRVVLGACVTNLVVVVAMVLMPLYPVLIILRFIAGCSVMAMLVPAWSHTLESTPAGYRSRVGMLLGLPFSASTVGFAGVGFMIREWRTLLLVCSSPILILLPVSFIMDESARWLVQEGQLQEATRVLEKALWQNKVQLRDSLTAAMDHLIKDSHVSSRRRSSSGPAPFLAGLQKLRAYLCAPAMRTIILVTPVLWFLHSCLYLGVVINANNFTSTDPFLYLALSGTMEALSILLITPLTAYLGRRIMVWAGLAVGGTLLMLQLLVTAGSGYKWVEWVLVMVAFLLVAGAFQVNYVYAPELFPTEARARGFAFVSVMGSVGFSCAPLVTHVLVEYSWWAVNVTFGCAGILGSLLVPLLPETNKRPLPETLQDVEDRSKHVHTSGKGGRRSLQDVVGGHTNLTPLLEAASSDHQTPESPHHHNHYQHLHQHHVSESPPPPEAHSSCQVLPSTHIVSSTTTVTHLVTSPTTSTTTRTYVVPSLTAVTYIVPSSTTTTTCVVPSSATNKVPSLTTTHVVLSSTTAVATPSSTHAAINNNNNNNNNENNIRGTVICNDTPCTIINNDDVCNNVINNNDVCGNVISNDDVCGNIINSDDIYGNVNNDDVCSNFIDNNNSTNNSACSTVVDSNTCSNVINNNDTCASINVNNNDTS
ncbi:solute carrier family 22 member 7-like isoform X2 [Panulirus ornatus]|uniref:solute carrier family 22 member 7-like isoform X2 n=1 Tax=Panulirus ornatus TaxID=150431 RepID=UPI003A89FE99